MTKRRRKWVLFLVRVGLCALFLTLVMRGVTLNDRVTVTSDDGGTGGTARTLRLVGEDADTITVVDDAGQERVLPRELIARDASGEPLIERGLAFAWRQSDGRVLLLAFVILTPALFLQSLRFMLLLRAQDVKLTYRESLRLTWGGNFLNFVFLIGSTAGDVFKAYYTSKHTARKTEAITTIMLDRIVGMSGLLIVAGTLSFVGTADPMLRNVGLFAWGLLGVLGIAAFVATSRLAEAFTQMPLLAKLPGASHIKRIHEATDRLIRHRALMAFCLLLSTVLQFVCVAGGAACAYALRMDFTGDKLWDYGAYIGAGNLIAAIPISVMGLGTMEFAYRQFFLGDYGTLGQLLCLALWVRLLQLFWALPGALVAFPGAYRPRDLELDEMSVAEDPPSDPR